MSYHLLIVLLVRFVFQSIFIVKYDMIDGLVYPTRWRGFPMKTVDIGNRMIQSSYLEVRSDYEINYSSGLTDWVIDTLATEISFLWNRRNPAAYEWTSS